MKHFLPITSLFLLFAMNALCCDTTRIDRTLWEIISVSSEETTGEGESNGHAIHALDNNLSTYWHTEWKEQKPDYPHHIAIDLKDTVDINAFSITTRGGTNNGRINQFELYITNDTTNWGIPQIAHQLDYPMPQKGEQQTSYYEFGAIKGRFFKLVGINSLHSDPYVMIAELNIYKDETCPATGQINQTIDFTTINNRYVQDR